MVAEVLKNKKKMLSNDNLVVEGKEFVSNELNVKLQPHAYDVEKIAWDNDMTQIHQTNPMVEKATSSLATQQRYKVLAKLY